MNVYARLSRTVRCSLRLCLAGVLCSQGPSATADPADGRCRPGEPVAGVQSDVLPHRTPLNPAGAVAEGHAVAGALLDSQ